MVTLEQDSSDNNGSSATSCSAMSSVIEVGEESSTNIELDFTLHHGCEKVRNLKKKLAPSNLKTYRLQSEVDLELSLSLSPLNQILPVFI
ncbi:hypothetical protein RIF29_19895 [Crotalaria pallida]|uniref:Uncharacterized protein n=1 Tax=Crotalaria pallida TaxID=3830 RepID=A0AAN9F2I4_CROPI